MARRQGALICVQSQPECTKVGAVNEVSGLRLDCGRAALVGLGAALQEAQGVNQAAIDHSQYLELCIRIVSGLATP